MKAVEKIRASEYWLAGEPFTIQDMRLALGIKASTVLSALRDMEHELSMWTEITQNGQQRFIYQRRMSRPWITGTGFDGEPTWRPGKLALELGRGWLPR